MAHSKFQKDTTPQTEVIAERKKKWSKVFFGPLTTFCLSYSIEL
jgi:hypothetical protein